MMSISIRPGDLVWPHKEFWGVALKVAAIFSAPVRDRYFALLWAPDGVPEKDTRVYPRQNTNTAPLGTIVQTSSITKDSPDSLRLFAMMQFDEASSKALSAQTLDAAITTELSQNLFDRGAMRVRLPPNPAAVQGGKRKRRNKVIRPGRSGYLVGDVTNAYVDTPSGELVISHAGLARGKGSKEFSRYADGGLPVLSSSSALLGWVVGEDDNHTLVLPAEDLMRQAEFRFRTFPGQDLERAGGAIRPASHSRKAYRVNELAE